MANKKRGYYQLNIGGKLRTLHFSMNFWVNFTDLLGLNLDELDSVFSKGVSIKNIRTLIYSGLLAYDQENGNEIDYNEFNVGDWLSDLSPDHLEKIVLAMTESKILGQDLNMGINRKQDVKIVNPEKKN
tara:strand:- start:307 stop:693 length:387 start_codon:yes stop_codon:yes gene_type:complete